MSTGDIQEQYDKRLASYKALTAQSEGQWVASQIAQARANPGLHALGLDLESPTFAASLHQRYQAMVTQERAGLTRFAGLLGITFADGDPLRPTPTPTGTPVDVSPTGTRTDPTSGPTGVRDPATLWQPTIGTPTATSPTTATSMYDRTGTSAWTGTGSPAPAGAVAPAPSSNPTVMIDPSTGRPSFTGPQGEGGYGGPQPGAVSWTMPDGRTAWYYPGQNIQQGNLTALSTWNSNANPNGTPQQQDAMAYLQQTLDQWGLGALANDAWKWLQQGQGVNQILQQIRATPQYQQMFPGMALRQAAGLPAISESEYLGYEREVRSAMSAAGLPAGFADTKDEIAQLIGHDVSVSEMQSRIKDGYLAAMQAPAEVRQQLSSLYGIDLGHLAAYFLDPNKAESVLMRQVAASQIAGESQITGFGNLNKAEAERLAALGVTPGQASSGFEKLAEGTQLFNPLPGEAAQSFTKDQQLDAMFGNNAAQQQALARQAELRVAEFGQSMQAGQGGTLASNAKGIAGIGSAQAA